MNDKKKTSPQQALPGLRGALTLSSLGDDFVGEFDQSWSQGRSIFGGLIAAAALSAMRSLVPAERSLRAFTANFISPLAPGSCRVSVQSLRTGGSASQVQARVFQDDTLVFTALGGFGLARQSQVQISGAPPPPVPHPGELTPLPFIPGLTPNFTQHLDLRLASGALPFTGAEAAPIGGWCRFREPVGNADAEVLLALMDAWPVPVLSMLTGPAPASTMSWSVSFLEKVEALADNNWWLFESEALAAADGYVRCRSSLWDAAGRPVALGEQMVAVFG